MQQRQVWRISRIKNYTLDNRCLLRNRGIIRQAVGHEFSSGRDTNSGVYRFFFYGLDGTIHFFISWVLSESFFEFLH